MHLLDRKWCSSLFTSQQACQSYE